jgi:hypothetical protein
MIKNWWCDATWEMRNKCVSHNVTIIGLTICFFMFHNSYKSKKWYLSMHRLAVIFNSSRHCHIIWQLSLQWTYQELLIYRLSKKKNLNNLVVKILQKVLYTGIGKNFFVKETMTRCGIFKYDQHQGVPKKNLPFSIINIFVSFPHVNPELSYKFCAAAEDVVILFLLEFIKMYPKKKKVR